MRKLYYLLFTLLFTVASFGQTVLYQEDFETDTNGTNYNTSVAEFTDGFYDFFKRTDGSDIGPDYVVVGQSGSFYFAGMDIDGEGATLPVTLTTIAIDVSGQSSIDAVILLAEDDDGTNQDWDGSDYLHITYSIDGGAAQNLLWVESDLDLNGTPHLDSDFDGIGDAEEITSSFAEFVGTIPLSGATSIVFTLEFNLNSGDEDIAIDNIRIFDSYVVPPTITTSAGVSGLNYTVGSGPSNEGSFTVEGTNLTDNILVTAPADFEISEISGGTFTPSITLLEGGTGAVAETTIYVRLKESLAINSYTGDVDLTSTGADPKTVALSGNVFAPTTNNLLLTGAYDGPLTGGTPKGVELYVVADIPDLSLFGIGSANNGEGTDGQEFTFPAVSATAGSFIYVTNAATEFNSFFGFPADYEDGSMGINGDDAIELFESGQVIDVFGDINTDGSGEPWDYLDGWAYRLSNTGPDGSTFVLANWSFSGINALDGETTNAGAATPFPVGIYPGFLSVDNFSASELKVYPNPTNTGFVNITSSSSDVIKANVFDILGKKVLEGKVENNQLNVSNLNAGMYILRLSQNNATVTKKLVIQ